jgi:hypothetical protein
LSEGLRACPRCGRPYSYLERHRIGKKVYLYAVHYEGYESGPDGRMRKRVRKCYLGPADSPLVSVGYTAAAPQAGDVYDRLSALIGLPAEEIERQIRELLEAERRLRELQGVTA